MITICLWTLPAILSDSALTFACAFSAAVAAGVSVAGGAAGASVEAAMVISVAGRWRGAAKSSSPASVESSNCDVLFMVDYRTALGVSTSERKATAPMPNSEA